MINNLRKLYLVLEQKLVCMLGATYSETTFKNAFGSGNLDEIVSEYCPITGRFIKEKAYLSEGSSRLLKKDLSSL